jgi:hypothetical protein
MFSPQSIDCTDSAGSRQDSWFAGGAGSPPVKSQSENAASMRSIADSWLPQSKVSLTLLDDDRGRSVTKVGISSHLALVQCSYLPGESILCQIHPLET